MMFVDTVHPKTDSSVTLQELNRRKSRQRTLESKKARIVELAKAMNGQPDEKVIESKNPRKQKEERPCEENIIEEIATHKKANLNRERKTKRTAGDYRTVYKDTAFHFKCQKTSLLLAQAGDLSSIKTGEFRRQYGVGNIG